MKRHYYADILTRAFITVLLSLMLGALISVLCGCRTKKEVTEHFRDTTQMMYTAKTDTLLVWKERTDSVVYRDSVFTLVKGDTVFVKEYHYRDRTNTIADALYEASTDTVWRVRTVTVYKTKTEVQEVEKRLAWWQSALMWIGGVALAAGIGLAVWKRYKPL